MFVFPTKHNCSFFESGARKRSKTAGLIKNDKQYPRLMHTMANWIFCGLSAAMFTSSAWFLLSIWYYPQTADYFDCCKMLNASLACCNQSHYLIQSYNFWFFFLDQIVKWHHSDESFSVYYFPVILFVLQYFQRKIWKFWKFCCEIWTCALLRQQWKRVNSPQSSRYICFDVRWENLVLHQGDIPWLIILIFILIISSAWLCADVVKWNFILITRREF